MDFDRPTQPLNLGRRACWNGPDCSYLRRGKCFFYHPPEHRDSLPSNTSVSPHIRSTLRERIREQERQIQRLQHLQIEESRYRRRRREVEQLQMDLERENFLRRSSQMRRSRREEQMLRESRGRSDNSSVDRSRDTENMGPEGQLITSSPKLNRRRQWERNRLWFFKKSLHFRIGKHTNKDEYQSCPICLSEYQPTDELTKLQCMHSFHTGCIEEWLLENDLCPLCKRDFREHEYFSKYDSNYMRRINQEWRQQGGYTSFERPYEEGQYPFFYNYAYDHEGSWEDDYPPEVGNDEGYEEQENYHEHEEEEEDRGSIQGENSEVSSNWDEESNSLENDSSNWDEESNSLENDSPDWSKSSREYYSHDENSEYSHGERDRYDEQENYYSYKDEKKQWNHEEEEENERNKYPYDEEDAQEYSYGYQRYGREYFYEEDLDYSYGEENEWDDQYDGHEDDDYQL